MRWVCALFQAGMSQSQSLPHAILNHSMPVVHVGPRASAADAVHVVTDVKTAVIVEEMEDVAMFPVGSPSELAGADVFHALSESLEGLEDLDRAFGAKTPSFDSPSSCSSCSMTSDSPAEEAIRPVIVAIDNDECIGSWGTCPPHRCSPCLPMWAVTALSTSTHSLGPSLTRCVRVSCARR